MSGLVAEFSTTSYFSAYSTSLMDVMYFQQRNVSHEILEQQLNDSLFLSNSSLLQFFQETSFECRKQFLLCWFENGYVFDCCDETMPLKVNRFLMHSGSCFEFQADPGLKQRLPGPVGGFGFAYWYPADELLSSAYNSYDDYGVHVYASPTEALLEKNPITIPIGTHARISLQATKTTRLATDQLGRNTCQEKPLKYFGNYSYHSCQVECLIDSLLAECGCIGVTTFGNLPKDKICTPTQAYSCFKSLAFRFSTILSQCRLQNCTEACVYWSYDVTMTSCPVFNPANREEMMKMWHLPDGDPSKSLIIGDVYFSNIEYMDIRQIPAMTLENFISNVGGAMGLWTGASIITWIHLIYFCLCSGSQIWRGRKKKLAANSSKIFKGDSIYRLQNMESSFTRRMKYHRCKSEPISRLIDEM